ncbi:MAG: hypothetical protein QGG40_02465 [Myxococcota bacterium]|jgi:hypothetical protein|nr:hypothetical protein [Myxococcota bacterium]
MTIQFTGHNRRDVKRKALSYWSRHVRHQGLTLRDFLQHCRLHTSERLIVYTAPH